MKVAFYVGPRATDDGRIWSCLNQNKDQLKTHGVEMPHHDKYRSPINKLIDKLDGAPVDEAEIQRIFDPLIGQHPPERLILGNPNFLMPPFKLLEDQVLFSNASYKFIGLSNIMAHHDLEIFITLRNPAMFVPKIFEDVENSSFTKLMRETDPYSIRWSHFIRRVIEAAPDVPVTVWCNEDTPLIWAEIIRAIAGFEPNIPIRGQFALLQEILTDEGVQRFQQYMRENPPRTASQLRRIMAAFIERFPRVEAIEEDINAPDWTQQIVTDMTEIYEEDLDHIADMPGVRMIVP
ncbi:MAG: hypothetical protein ACPGVK_08855 [Halocynthiibacter sp.]